MTKLPGCRSVFERDDFQPIQETISGKNVMVYYRFSSVHAIVIYNCIDIYNLNAWLPLFYSVLTLSCRTVVTRHVSYPTQFTHAHM
jgi:hypothetical protein